MPRAPQERRLKTRAKLLTVAEEIIRHQGYSALRVEEVAAQAGTAKGTLFSHFKDKDGLLAVIIGKQVMTLLDEMQSAPAPTSVPELTAALGPLVGFIAQDRVIFDLLLRYSGTTGEIADETVTQGFYRQNEIFCGWMKALQKSGMIRDDQTPELLSEGVQAFINQVLAIWFCLDHQNGDTPQTPPLQALEPFLIAWLRPLT